MILTKELVDIVQLDFLNKVLMFCKYLESSYATDFHKFLWSVEATYLVKFRPFFRKYKMKYTYLQAKYFPYAMQNLGVPVEHGWPSWIVWARSEDDFNARIKHMSSKIDLY